MKRYYEMEVTIKGIVRVPIGAYDNKDEAIECIEMIEDLTEVAENIQNNNDKVFFVGVNKKSVKEVGC